MNFRRNVLIATVAVAAAAVSACSPAQDKPWPAPSPAGATETLKSAAPSPASVTRWKNVTRLGNESPRDSAKGDNAQIGNDPEPGIKILRVINAENRMRMCTIGPAIVGDPGRGFLTAGHCVEGVSPMQYLKSESDGRVDPWAPVVDRGTGSDDTGVIWSNRASTNATRIADTWPVSGVVTIAGAQKLVPVGSTVCVDGTRSGVLCGARVPDRAGAFTYSIPTKVGDSGSPVFVVDAATNAAVIIGIHTDGDEQTWGSSSYADPALSRLNAKLLLDPTATPLKDDGFSDRAARAR